MSYMKCNQKGCYKYISMEQENSAEGGWGPGAKGHGKACYTQ